MMYPTQQLRWRSKKRFARIEINICHEQFTFQFLKKVQKQDRIVEEVKLLLKPAYNDRKITKESYKEILKKTIPKVSSFYRFDVLLTGLSFS